MSPPGELQKDMVTLLKARNLDSQGWVRANEMLVKAGFGIVRMCVVVEAMTNDNE